MRKFGAFLLVLFAPAAGLWLAAQAPTHVVIMHTNDIHGQLLPRAGIGGMGEIAAIIRRAKPDLVLDAGDFSTGTFLADEFRGVPTIASMNQIRYTSGTIGNHEFDYGQPALRMLIRQARFPILSANIAAPVPGIKKYAIISSQGIRFGIIGLTTERVKTLSHPNDVVGVKVFDIVKSVETLLPEVRKRSDVIIATVHLEDEEEQRLASAFPEIRLIIGGHNHEALGPIRLGQTLVAKTGVAGRNVGRVDLEFQNKKLVRMDARLIPVKDVQAELDVVKILQPFQEKVNAKMGEIIGEKGKTQIALQNIGGIRARIIKGSVTWGNAFEVLPFQNTLITLKLTGDQLKKTLEHGLVSSIGMVAISGIRVQFDTKNPAGKQVASLLLTDGTPVDDSKLYSITTNDFVLAGGDGFTEFAKGTDIKDTGILLRDVLVDYIKARRVLSPVLDERIIVK